MPNTTNFNWATPADTDLVKDGAAAIRTLGNSIDASFVDLKGGTTGQVLAKASNTDLDFTWTNGGDITEVVAGTGLSGGGTSGSVTLTNTVATTFDSAGDLVYGTGADTFTKLSLGTAGQVLTVNSGATAPEWQTLNAGAFTQLASGNLSGTSVSLTSISGSYKDLMLVIRDYNAGTNAGGYYLGLTINSDTGTNYLQNSIRTSIGWGAATGYGQIYLTTDDVDRQSDKNNAAVVHFYDYANTTSNKQIQYNVSGWKDSAYYQEFGQATHRPATAAAITSIQIISTVAFSGGTYILYGVK